MKLKLAIYGAPLFSEAPLKALYQSFRPIFIIARWTAQREKYPQWKPPLKYYHWNNGAAAL